VADATSGAKRSGLFPGSRWYTKGHRPESAAHLLDMWTGRMPKGRRDRVFVRYESPPGSGMVLEAPADDFLDEWYYDRFTVQASDEERLQSAIAAVREREERLRVALEAADGVQAALDRGIGLRAEDDSVDLENVEGCEPGLYYEIECAPLDGAVNAYRKARAALAREDADGD
jgi:hypothetical protein